jgi:Rad3-related DNA helicase
MDDSAIREQIEQLVNEEKELLSRGEGQGPDEERHARLAEIKVELDRCWDLLRQREAREEFKLDPDDASVRDADTVEGYEG